MRSVRPSSPSASSRATASATLTAAGTPARARPAAGGRRCDGRRTLYWHLPNKAALITAVADRILDQEFTDLTPPRPRENWPDWLASLAGRLRRALLAHPDGARILSASQLSVTMAAISELAMSTLVARGIPLRPARVIVLTVERFTVGYVLEEQAPRPDADALRGFDMTGFAEQHPTMIAAITEYFEPGRTVDDLFAECLGLVIEGAAARSGAAS